MWQSEGYPEVTVRESPNQLTLRPEEVGTWKSHINVDHMAKQRWGGRVMAKLGRRTKVCLPVTREGNVGDEALHVIGLYGPGGKIAFFLQDWELAKVALSCHMAVDMLCQEIHGAW